MSKSKEQNLRPAMMVIIAVLIAGSAMFGVYANTLMDKDTINNGVYIGGIDVGGITKAEAEETLHKELDVKNLLLKSSEEEFNINLEELGFDMDFSSAVEEAFNVGRDGGYFSNLITTFKHENLGEKTEIDIEKAVNMESLDPVFASISEQINRQPVNASISFDGGMHILPEQVGTIVDMDKLKSDVKLAYEEGKTPLEIEIPMKEVVPNITEEQLKPINGLMASYVTKFDNPQGKRAFNVGLAAKRVSNVIIMPGEEFSFLNTLGDISEASGYLPSTVIIDNEYVDGIGGGVCQVSSTLYNAMLRAGITVVSRVNHTYPQTYVPMGTDATIAINGPDMIMRNDHQFPVYLVNYIVGNTMHSEIYGDASNFTPYNVTTKLIETYDFEKKYEDDPTLPKGKEVIDEMGKKGYKIATYLERDGESRLLNYSVYKTKNAVIKRGTGPEKEEDKKDQAPNTQNEINDVSSEGSPIL